MLDFSQPGELGALMDEATLCQLDDDALEQDERMCPAWRRLGTCSARTIFYGLSSLIIICLARIHSRSTYCTGIGTSPGVPFDIHSYYLQNFYRGNSFVESDGIAIGERRLDLRKVKIPTYVLSTREDHITPWKSAYKTTQLLPGSSRFTLAASGHWPA